MVVVVVEIVVVVVVVASVATVVVDGGGDGDRGCLGVGVVVIVIYCVNVWMWRSVDVDVDVNGDVNMDGLWWMRRLPGVVGGKWASVDGGGRCTCVHTILMRRPLLKEYSLISCTPAHTHHTLLSMCA